MRQAAVRAAFRLSSLSPRSVTAGRWSVSLRGVAGNRTSVADQLIIARVSGIYAPSPDPAPATARFPERPARKSPVNLSGTCAFYIT